MIDFLTKTQHERSEQIDKVNEFYEDAYRAYGDGRFAKATNALCKLRDYLNSINLPGRKPKRNCDKFADEDDAFAAWHESLNDGDIVSVRNAFDWLFAPAEGGAK